MKDNAPRSEGLETLSEADHIQRSLRARCWKGETKTVIDSTTRSEIRLIEAVDDSQCRPESVTACVWRHPEWCISSTTACEHTEAEESQMASNVRDDYFIRSSLSKLKLAEFSGDRWEWPEWSQLFQASVHAANIDDSVKMNHLKTMVTGKAKEAIAGLGYTAEMYSVTWNVLVRNFGKPQLVVNAQLKRLYPFPP